MDYELADISDTGKFVEFHIRVQHSSRRLVHDLLFVEGVRDSHYERAVTLAFGELGVDDQAAILDGDHLVYFYYAGFNVDANVRHLDAPYAAVGQVARPGVLAPRRYGSDSKLGAGLFPG